MIDFVGTHILENRILGCHGIHAFSYNLNKFFYDKIFHKLGVPMKDMAPI